MYNIKIYIKNLNIKYLMFLRIRKKYIKKKVKYLYIINNNNNNHNNHNNYKNYNNYNNYY